VLLACACWTGHSPIVGCYWSHRGQQGCWPTDLRWCWTGGLSHLALSLPTGTPVSRCSLAAYGAHSLLLLLLSTTTGLLCPVRCSYCSPTRLPGLYDRCYYYWYCFWCCYWYWCCCSPTGTALLLLAYWCKYWALLLLLSLSLLPLRLHLLLGCRLGVLVLVLLGCWSTERGSEYVALSPTGTGALAPYCSVLVSCCSLLPVPLVVE